MSQECCSPVGRKKDSVHHLRHINDLAANMGVFSSVVKCIISSSVYRFILKGVVPKPMVMWGI